MNKLIFSWSKADTGILALLDCHALHGTARREVITQKSTGLQLLSFGPTGCLPWRRYAASVYWDPARQSTQFGLQQFSQMLRLAIQTDFQNAGRNDLISHYRARQGEPRRLM